MAFDGNEGTKVTLQEASVWTEAYRRTIQSGDTIGHFFGMNKYNDLLAQPGCVGIRTYYGIENGEKVLVLVGVDANENDMVDGVIIEVSSKCPPRCSIANGLNG